MPFPEGYEKAEVYEGYERIALGGHLCTIHALKVGESAAGNKMLIVELDTSIEDAQPLFYSKRHEEDKKSDLAAPWRCVYRIVVDERLTDKNGRAYGLSNLKGFITTIEHSNEGLTISGDNYGVNNAWFAQQFLGKKVGAVFGEEEYRLPDGQVRISVKPKYLCNYSKALEQKIPEIKRLEQTPANDFSIPAGFLEDEGLPFK